VALPTSQINIWGKSANRIQSDDRTNKQTNTQTEITTLSIDVVL
jgi:hypothetical protein